MIGWIREQFGLCGHDWKFVRPIMSASGWDRYHDKKIPAIQLGDIRRCRKCGIEQHIYEPDGH